jgi:hypothetical protein
LALFPSPFFLSAVSRLFTHFITSPRKFCCSFAYRGQANSSTLPYWYTSTIITYLYTQTQVESETNSAGVCLGMTNHICHTFLHNAVGCDFDGSGKGREDFRRIERYT